VAHDDLSDLGFPPPWWHLPAVVALFVAVFSFIGDGGRSEQVLGAGLGFLVFFTRYIDGERATLFRLQRRIQVLEGRAAVPAERATGTDQSRPAP
jgi:hypothetical protein